MVPGVADVVIRGGYIKQYQVSPDQTKMKSHGVTLQQVFASLGRGNMNAGGGYIEQGEQQFIIRGVGLLRSPDDIRNVVVAEKPRHALALGAGRGGAVVAGGVDACFPLRDLLGG